MTNTDKALKRAMDIIISLTGLLLVGWLIVPCIILVRAETNSTGFFRQKRVGRDGVIFEVIKLRTMKDVAGVTTTVTTDRDIRITKSGRFFRKTKLDEVPQLLNVIKGDMSIVGPRPDVPGFADLLEGEDRIILSIRPGITGPASIYYKNEEELLAVQNNPVTYNRNVIWPHKVELNKKYISEYSLIKDLYYIYATLV
jgi:lipopolysaccharide/colanic/teichoic acid biosynthesis glycosyltransferase